MLTGQLCRTLPFTILSLVHPASIPPQKPPPCEIQRLLPAYSHNDYRNRHPLEDALALGFQGVEADYLLVDGELRVGHGRGDTMRGRTLERLYLAPLRDRLRRCGWIQANRKPFLLTIEYKERERHGYEALRELLARYGDLAGTAAQPGPVRVVLVGWHPPLSEMAGETPQLSTVQARLTRTGLQVPAGDRGLIGLVSLDYGKTMQWKGRGPLRSRDQQVLHHLAAARRALPGRLVRAYDVPVSREVYRLLLRSGVDLIGTKHLGKSATILEGVTRDIESGS